MGFLIDILAQLCFHTHQRCLVLKWRGGGLSVYVTTRPVLTHHFITEWRVWFGCLFVSHHNLMVCGRCSLGVRQDGRKLGFGLLLGDSHSSPGNWKFSQKYGENCWAERPVLVVTLYYVTVASVAFWECMRLVFTCGFCCIKVFCKSLNERICQTPVM